MNHHRQSITLFPLLQICRMEPISTKKWSFRRQALSVASGQATAAMGTRFLDSGYFAKTISSSPSTTGSPRTSTTRKCGPPMSCGKVASPSISTSAARSPRRKRTCKSSRRFFSERFLKCLKEELLEDFADTEDIKDQIGNYSYWLAEHRKVIDRADEFSQATL